MFSLPSSTLGVLIGILYILVAAWVTVDVLLKKSDVRGALGWIGAAWFSPILGGLLYFLLGINRVTRRALKMSRLDDAQSGRLGTAARPQAPAHICELLEIGGRVTKGPLAADNEISVLDGGDIAYPQMLAAIAGARKSIALTSYIFRDDAAGRVFAEALIAAKTRGVMVRVLLDSVGGGYIFPRSFHRLRAGGVRVARFLHTWLPWRMPFLNMRNHRKLLVVDGATAFMGGMNIGAENSMSLHPRDYITDIHFRIQGPVVRLVMDAFARDWSFTTDETLDEEFWWPELPPAGPVYARGLSSGPDADIYKLETILGAALTLAKKRIRILTPYFLPDARLQFAIAQACLRGVEVDIVIPERCNYLVMDWAMRAHLRFFRHIAANIYTTPLPFDHSKLCTLDDGWCLIGSSNWDARSFRLNFEFDLECYDPALVNVLDDIIDAKIARGTRLEIRALIARPVWIRLRDAAARLMMPYL
ncbi:MAG TPA: phospholipase D-like domain-containing protein [Rhizomicrobium sp.]|nr:phospholipase D-like domain-containing protein [Rhizomicrobium sp.]